ncbi:hypothetical protein [Streptomyces chattanoogensis]|uniref:hypothetical protein n=1 Tax=Streptomyces chattanoogensis TaxID=66876 RepID=UPI0005D7D6C8|nr:hypothetical protein T261_8571 [Streptomyces lydicus]
MSVLEWYRSVLCEDYGEDLTARILDDPGFPGFVGEVHAVEGGELNAVACEVACHAVEYLDDNPDDSADDAYAELRRRLRG